MNKILLLTTSSQLPLLITYSEKIDIFIDESIAFQRIYEKTQAKRFITAFYAIKSCDLQKLSQEYKKVIYLKSKAKREKKSCNVSDKENLRALTVAQKYLLNATIVSRQTMDLSELTTDQHINLNIALELRSYIYPLKQIIQSIQSKYQNKYQGLQINLKFDRNTQNANDPYLSWNQKTLRKIQTELNKTTDLIINYNTLDSRNSYGVQVADMLAGAYRKERTYLENDCYTQLIPFSYELIELDNLKEDTQFLEILGKLTLNDLSINWITPNSKNNVNFLFHLFFNLYSSMKSWFNQPFISQNQLKLARKNIRKARKNQLNETKRQQIIFSIITLNDHLKILAQKSQPKSSKYIYQLSKSSKQKHYLKTLDNISRNLNILELDLPKAKRRRFFRYLHSFNKQVSETLN